MLPLVAPITRKLLVVSLNRSEGVRTECLRVVSRVAASHRLATASAVVYLRHLQGWTKMKSLRISKKHGAPDLRLPCLFCTPKQT